MSLGVLGLLEAASLVWGSNASMGQQLLAIFIAALLGSIALAWIASDKAFKQTPLPFIFAFALVLRLIAIQATPLLEDDYFRYLWDGRQTATQLSPYQYAPEHFFSDGNLPTLWQNILSGINHPDVPSIYGPILQALFGLAYFIAPGKIGVVQGQLLVIDMLTLWILARFQHDPRWLLAYAIHPLILKESMASAHPDILLGLFVICAVLAWQRHRATFTGVFLAAAAATKIPALIALALMLFRRKAVTDPDNHWSECWSECWSVRWSLVVSVAFLASLSLVYLPFIISGGSEASALVTFGSRWRFNPLLFRFFELMLDAQPARFLAAILVLAGVGFLAWRKPNIEALENPPICLAIALLLLLSPTVNPWYWLWVLAPAVLLGQFTAVIAGCIGMISYWNSSVTLISEQWIAASLPFQVSVPMISTALQIIVIGGAWIRDYRGYRRLDRA